MSVTTKHSQIVDYWRYHALPKNPHICVVEDIGEPRCFACGKLAIRKGEKEDRLREELGIQMWDDAEVKRNLNRCHIIPKSLGGEDKPYNLFLLCPECHKESPDTYNPDIFFGWVERKRSLYSNGEMTGEQFLKAVKEEVERKGYIWEDVVNNMPDKQDYFSKFLKGKITTHGFNLISDSTKIGIAVDYLIKNHEKVVTKRAKDFMARRDALPEDKREELDKAIIHISQSR